MTLSAADIHLVYAIRPHGIASPPDFVKLGRWRGSVNRLMDRYKTYYPTFDITVFQCDNSVLMERSLFDIFSKFRYKRELFHSVVYDLFVETIGPLCLPHIYNLDLVVATELRRLKLSQKTELDNLRNNLKCTKSDSKPLKKPTVTHADKVDHLTAKIDTLKRSVEEKARSKLAKRQKQDEDTRLSIVTFLNTNTVDGPQNGPNAVWLENRKLYQAYCHATPHEANKKNKVGIRRFLATVENIWDRLALPEKTLPGGQAKAYRVFMGKALLM